MDFLKLIGFLLLLLANQAVGADPGTFIAGGSPVTNINQFPSFVGVQHAGFARFCGGVILNHNHVLTSGSCVLNENKDLIAASQLFVRGGDLTLGASAIIPVLLVYIHPTYNPFTNVNDLAVLRTAANINLQLLGLAVANINHDIVGDNTECVIPGWNVVAGAPLHTLQYLVQPILNRDTCNNIHNRRVDETMLCAGAITANSGVCPSNVGGGLYCNGNVSAILSFGTGCGAANSPGVYTQIRFFEQWIQAQLTRNDIPQPGPTPAPMPPGLPDSGSLIHLSIVLVFVVVGNLARNVL